LTLTSEKQIQNKAAVHIDVDVSCLSPQISTDFLQLTSASVVSY